MSISEQELRALVELGGKASPRPWKLWTGWGPYKADGLMRCERVGPESDGGIRPSSPAMCPDLKATLEDFEYVAHAANLAVPLAEECLALRAENAALIREKQEACYQHNEPDPDEDGGA